MLRSFGGGRCVFERRCVHFLCIWSSSALAAFHGIATAKGCASPVKIGDPYTCAVQILNSVDTGHDTVRVTGLSDRSTRPAAR